MKLFRKIKNIFANFSTFLSMIVVIFLSGAIIYYCFSNGFKHMSFKMFVNDYYETAYYLTSEKEDGIINEYLTYDEKEYYSSSWGISLIDDKDLEGNDCVKINYIHENSPLLKSQDNKNQIKSGMVIKRVQLIIDDKNEILTYKDGAKLIVNKLELSSKINELYFCSLGGGFRGSLLSTIYLILLTLLFSLSLGIFVALYLANYAKENKFTKILRTLIDMISGIPSIIFGLVGVIIFIPIVSKFTPSNGLSIIAGALTMSIMLLPLIIKNVEDAINAIPKGYKMSSLALGASETQTTFKIILPNAINGILTSTLLSIGRIIGESAALIFVMGSAIQDKVSIFEGATTLSTHIWNVIAGENPNYSLACSISIVILIVVFILNLLVKLSMKRLNRLEVK